MKRILIILVLFFSSSVFAEDISDFEIEGMSIGDSLLDFISEEEILEKKHIYKKSDKFFTSAFQDLVFLKQYDGITFGYKKNDPNYIIFSISGVLFYKKNIKDCYDKKIQIQNDLSTLIKNIEWKERKYSDNDGEFTNAVSSFRKQGDILVSCYDWNDNMEKEGFIDSLKIIISHRDFSHWLNNET